MNFVLVMYVFVGENDRAPPSLSIPSLTHPAHFNINPLATPSNLLCQHLHPTVVSRKVSLLWSPRPILSPSPLSRPLNLSCTAQHQRPSTNTDLRLERLGRYISPNLPKIRQRPLIIKRIPLEAHDGILSIHARHAAQLLDRLDLFRRKTVEGFGEVGSVDLGRCADGWGCRCGGNRGGRLDLNAVPDDRASLGVVCRVGEERVDDQGVGENLAGPAFFGRAMSQYTV